MVGYFKPGTYIQCIYYEENIHLKWSRRSEAAVFEHQEQCFLDTWSDYGTMNKYQYRHVHLQMVNLPCTARCFEIVLLCVRKLLKNTSVIRNTRTTTSHMETFHQDCLIILKLKIQDN